LKKMDPEIPPQQSKLPVIPNAEAAYRFVYLNFGRLFVIAGAPLLLAALVAYWVDDQWLAWEIEVRRIGLPAKGPVWLILASVGAHLISTVALAFAAVRIHRLALFGDGRTGPSGTALDLKFISTAFAVELAILAPVYLFLGLALWTSPNPGIGRARIVMIVATPLALVLSLRIATAFPHLVATGELNLSKAWRQTSGSWWRLFGTFFVALLPLWFVTGSNLGSMRQRILDAATPTQAVAMLTSSRDSLPMTATILFVFQVVITAISVAVAVNAYRYFSGRPMFEPLRDRPTDAG
jgi:hypothetical protein